MVLREDWTSSDKIYPQDLNGIAAAVNANSSAIDNVTGFSDTTISYDTAGNVHTVTEGGVVTTYTYTTDGAVNTDTRNSVTRQYTYDGSGNLTGIEVV